MNFEKNTQECKIELEKLIAKAVCWRQSSKVQLKPKDSAPPSAGPTKIEETTQVKREELPGRTLIKNGGSTTGRQQAQAVVSSVALSAPIITGWRDQPKSTLQYLADYRPYQPAGSRGLAVSTWVKEQAKKPLTTLERKTGYLYVYWNRANFGVYKIGYSCVDVKLRLRRWQTQCKHTAQGLYWTPVEVPNVRRLERLVHAELKDYRVEEKCCRGCKKSHKEWFNVDLKLIVKCIKFWTAWVRKEQYEGVGSEWRLKEDARNELPQLCTWLTVVNAEESKEKLIRRSPPRHNLRPRMAKTSSSKEKSRTLVQKSQKMLQSFS